MSAIKITSLSQVTPLSGRSGFSWLRKWPLWAASTNRPPRGFKTKATVFFTNWVASLCGQTTNYNRDTVKAFFWSLGSLCGQTTNYIVIFFNAHALYVDLIEHAHSIPQLLSCPVPLAMTSPPSCRCRNQHKVQRTKDLNPGVLGNYFREKIPILIQLSLWKFFRSLEDHDDMGKLNRRKGAPHMEQPWRPLPRLQCPNPKSTPQLHSLLCNLDTREVSSERNNHRWIFFTRNSPESSKARLERARADHSPRVEG